MTSWGTVGLGAKYPLLDNDSASAATGDFASAVTGDLATGDLATGATNPILIDHPPW